MKGGISVFELDLKSRKPISNQIVDNIKILIVSGVLVSGEKLPSVRDLSSELTLNPNTVQKAFRILEHQGYIYSSPGRGTFVQEKNRIVPTEKEIKEVRHHIEESLNMMFYIGMTKKEAGDMILSMLQGKENWK